MLIRKATTSDLELVTHIEATCFPPAEAAPREAFKERLDRYAGQFLIAFDGDTPIGFIDGDRLVGLIRVMDDSELVCKQCRCDGERYEYNNTKSDNR